MGVLRRIRAVKVGEGHKIFAIFKADDLDISFEGDALLTATKPTISSSMMISSAFADCI